MTVRFKAHQLREPLNVGALLALDNIQTLPAIADFLAKAPKDALRSHRRILLNTLRYVRSNGIQANPRQWTEFAEKIAEMPLVWDEAKDGRYRYRVPGQDILSPRARTILLKSTLDQTPPGWQASDQTRQHYRYVAKHLPKEFQTFVPDSSASLGHSMRALVAQKFPSPHSSFIETLMTGRVASLAPEYWPKKQPTLPVNDKWAQAAFALARHSNNEILVKGIHAQSWFATQKSNPMTDDKGVALSFFEIIHRLPKSLGRPTWMAAAFGQMLSHEKEASFIERGWKAVDFTEDERLSLILSLAQNYPSSAYGRGPLGDLLKCRWTIPAEERKAQALQAYQTFGENQPSMSVNVLMDDAREWIALLVPELQPMLDLYSGPGASAGPAEEIMQLQQLLTPAETTSIELPASFNDSVEVRDLMPK